MKQTDKFAIMLLSIAAAIAVLLSVMAYLSTNSSILPDIAGVIATPFRSVSSAITNTIDGYLAYMSDFDALKEENEKLKLQIAEMEAEVRQAKADSDENARLRELAELREQRRDLHLESARVLEQDASNWSSMS